MELQTPSFQHKEQHKRTLMFLLSLLIWSLLTGGFALVWYRYYSLAIQLPFFRRGNWMVIGVYGALSFCITKLYGGYRIGYLKRGDVIFSSAMSTLFVNVITYCQISLIGRQFMNPVPMIWMTVVHILLICIWGVLGHKLYQRIYPPRKMLLISGSEYSLSLINKISTRSEKYQICEVMDINQGLETIFPRVLDYEAVVISDVKAEYRNKLLKFCFLHSVRTYVTPKISDTIIRGADSIHLFDTPLLLCRNMGLTAEQRLAKRMLDIGVSVVGLVLSSPFMLLTALAIKVYDGGPVIYRQRRLTMDGREFDIYKFRSMVMDAEKGTGARLAQEHDARITPVGKVIRKIRFDELPQLFNILRGDMSVVGPRPERPEIAEEYRKAMPEFDFRLKVKAGLTGYAQVMGKYNTTPYDKLKLDLMYIENYSILLDIKLILMTIKVLLIPSSTEGVGEHQMTAQAEYLQREGGLDRTGKEK